MASRDWTRDPLTGCLTLQESTSYRRLGLTWVVSGGVILFIGFRGVPTNPGALLSALIFGLGIGSLGVYLALSQDTVVLDPKTRTLVKRSGFLFYHPEPTVLSFSEIANIEVKYYFQTNGKGGGHAAWMVRTIDRAGNVLMIDDDGGRDDMLDLGQQVAAMTGAPLLDHSHNHPYTGPRVLDKLLGRAGAIHRPDPEPAAPPAVLTPDTTVPNSPAGSNGVVSTPVEPHPDLADPAPVYGSAIDDSAPADGPQGRTNLIALAVVAGVLVMGLILALAAWTPTH